MEYNLYYVNWQREVQLQEINGTKVIVKINKLSKGFHEFLLAAVYTLMSILLGHPCRPPPFGRQILNNEDFDSRSHLHSLSIPTPKLLFISESIIIEEYIQGGDLYRTLSLGAKVREYSYLAGVLTGRLHNAGYVFTDNKAQNYLVSEQENILYRTDLGFLQKSEAIFSKSIDIASFLASVIDLQKKDYSKVEENFFDGYKSVTGKGFPYLSITLRNILAMGLASERLRMIKNMSVDSMKFIQI